MELENLLLYQKSLAKKMAKNSQLKNEEMDNLMKTIRAEPG